MRPKVGRSFLGDYLVQEGVISQDQLDGALAYQSANKGKALLGQTLIKLGFCSEEDIARAMAKRSGFSYVSLEDQPIDTSAVTSIPVDAIKRYRVLPIGFEGDKLVVVMKNPTDIVALDDLRMMTGLEIKPVVASDTELDSAIEKYSRASVGFELSDDDVPSEVDAVVETDESAERPAVQLANMIIADAVNAKASDIHIEPYEKHLRVRFRIDGVLHDTTQPPRRMHAPLVSRIKVMANMDIADRRIPQDGRISLKIEGRSIDVRVASLPTSFGERLTLRLLDRSNILVTLDQLGISPEVLGQYRDTLKLPYGFVLVTGPTGSGKTTTLYASLSTVDRQQKNVITIEDPVEYHLDAMNQIQINPKAGLTFASGLRSILRSDPDIIMVGEIRDQETARIAVESALTGHLVFSTLHTNDAAGAVSRLTEMGVEPFLTSSSLACVLAQRLARLLCPHCKEAYSVARLDLEKMIGFPPDDGESSVTLYRPAGCMRCSQTGYRGRVGVYEVLYVSDTIQRMILERKSTSDIKAAAIAEGMITLYQDGMAKVKQGITSLEEIARVVL